MKLQEECEEFVRKALPKGLDEFCARPKEKRAANTAESLQAAVSKAVH